MASKQPIAIVGTGNMGPALARKFAAAGYPIVIGSRDAKKGAALAAELGKGATGGSVAEAVAAAEVVVLAVPFDHMAEAAAETGPMAGKVVVDVSNPFTADLADLQVGHTTSAAEELQKLLPEARVVKALHLFFATWLDDGRYDGTGTYRAPHAGDDDAAKAAVAELEAALGFQPVDAGPLKAARCLEPLAMLLMKVGYDGVGRAA